MISVSVLGGIVGAYCTYYFTVKAKRNEAMLKFKEEKYSSLLALLTGFQVETFSFEQQEAFAAEQYKTWLYAPDEVVKAIKRFLDVISISKAPLDQAEVAKIRGNMILAMRKDLLGDTSLNCEDFTYRYFRKL